MSCAAPLSAGRPTRGDGWSFGGGTGSSNLACSSGESANLRSLAAAPRSRGANRIGHLPAFVVQRVGQHHFGAFAHEDARRGRADALCRAGDDGNFARKSHDCLSFCFRERIVSQLLGSAQQSTEPSPNRRSRPDHAVDTGADDSEIQLHGPFGRVSLRRHIWDAATPRAVWEHGDRQPALRRRGLPETATVSAAARRHPPKPRSTAATPVPACR
jgi:hypothetical protein